MNNKNDNISNKNVTHTDHRSKTKSNNVTDDYKYIPGSERAESSTGINKRPSSGNIKGV